MTTRQRLGEYLRSLRTKIRGATTSKAEVAPQPDDSPKVVAQSPKTATRPKRKRSLPRRRYHLGLDWGTSTTKLVLRDYDSPRGELGVAYVLRPAGDSGYRYPSTIAYDDGKVFFGDVAEKRRDSCASWWVSLKAQFALGAASPDLPATLTVTDLAVLSLAHTMRIGMLQANRLAEAIKHEARFSVTVGVPVVELEEPLARNEYLTAVRTAFTLAVREKVDVQGIEVNEALALLETARTTVASADARRPSTNEVTFNWLRPELAAGMYWSFRSPTIDKGLYGGVDIGAGTTNAVFFRIHHRQVGEQLIDKGALSFYGGACKPPGMDAIDEVLAAETGQSPAAIRGQEAGLLGRPALLAASRRHIDGYVKTYKAAFSEGYRKEARQSSWNKLNIILFGGGSKLKAVRKAMAAPPWRNLNAPRLVETLGCPPDLCELPTRPRAEGAPFAGDPTFLLVAYGLAVHYLDFPPYRLPSEVSDLKSLPGRHFTTFDDLGYDK